jgi:hypothetical protein
MHETLRPRFTEQVAGYLSLLKSCNIYGSDGKGMQRLIEDLSATCPANTQFVHIPMRAYADSFSAFLMALSNALGIEADSGITDIRLLIETYLKKPECKNIWLCLSHFDRLEAATVDAKTVDVDGYNLNFLNYLNAISSNPNKIGLLVCSDKQVKTVELYIGGSLVRGSRLEFSQKLALSELTLEEIEAYLFLRMPNDPKKASFFKKKPSFFPSLLTEIYNHPEPVPFVEYIATQPVWNLRDMNAFDQALAHWKKEYSLAHRSSLGTQISTLERWTRKLKHNSGRVFNLFKIWNALHLRWKIAITAITTLAIAYWQMGEKILAFCGF